MTSESSPDNERQNASDQVGYDFQYDHGRMPFFMKVVWIVFLAFGTWYTVSFLLTALGEEMGG
jgi:hypothetical protein